MTDDTFLYDTYALIELLNKNFKYEKYADCNIVINDFIFAEFCYKVFLEKIPNGEELLNEIIDSIVYPSKEVIKEASIFRVKFKSRNMSMTDCISYIMSKKLGIKFLTGDKEFENLENVEFVRK